MPFLSRLPSARGSRRLLALPRGTLVEISEMRSPERGVAGDPAAGGLLQRMGQTVTLKVPVVSTDGTGLLRIATMARGPARC